MAMQVMLNFLFVAPYILTGQGLDFVYHMMLCNKYTRFVTIALAPESICARGSMSVVESGVVLTAGTVSLEAVSSFAGSDSTISLTSEE